jgi:eukaryotic-like serine/threonine-protein kinase
MASCRSRKAPAMFAGCRPAPALLPAGATRDAADQEIGMLLAGRYRLAEVVGRGATASVWRARDELLDRDVAVKHFRERQSFAVAEARLAARVRHPNVAAVHDLVRHAGSSWLVMDFHGVTTLATLLRGGRRLPPPVVAGLGQQLLAALRAVHAAGVVHCDVKPSNLLLGDDGRMVLIDFGIAEAVGGAPAHPARRKGDVVGSPAYLAPELVRGAAPQPAADLWSLGATLYTAVEGHGPFPRGDAVSTLTAVLSDPPAPTRRAGRLQPLLARLLDKEATRRPSHDAVQALLVDLLIDADQTQPSHLLSPPQPGSGSGPLDCPTGSVRWRSVPSGVPAGGGHGSRPGAGLEAGRPAIRAIATSRPSHPGGSVRMQPRSDTRRANSPRRPSALSSGARAA